jgi:hypothetical protein
MCGVCDYKVITAHGHDTNIHTCPRGGQR